jgi:hypothetical protein
LVQHLELGPASVPDGLESKRAVVLLDVPGYVADG